MRRVGYYITISTDGMYADPHGGLGGFDPAEEEHRFANYLVRDAGDIVMGRVMYSVMDYWDELDLDDANVSDVERAKTVYTALLGAEPTADSAYYVGYDVAGQHIGLLPGGGPQGLTSPAAYWHVDDIEAKIAEVTAAGATLRDPVSEVGGGRVVASVVDPDGNVLGLIQDKEAR